MELWDLIDEHGKPLGQKIEKGAPHAPGTYHIVIGVWVIAEDKKALVTKRGPLEVQYPNLWENTGGSILSGETSRAGAIRELKEETGIEAKEEDLIFLGESLEKTALIHIFSLPVKSELTDLTLQTSEIADAKWVTKAEWEKMIADGEVADSARRRMRAVEEKLKNLGFCE